jgi:uncharacterized membrane protein
MRHETKFTMMSPAPGFTSRVMMRLAERERAQARRRAMLGSALLVIVAVVILALVAWWFIAMLSTFVSAPSVIVAVLNALATLMLWVSKFFEMMWTAASVVAQSIDPVSILGLAVAVFAVTLVWVRLVIGPFQPSSNTLLVGGPK